MRPNDFVAPAIVCASFSRSKCSGPRMNAQSCSPPMSGRRSYGASAMYTLTSEKFVAAHAAHTLAATRSLRHTQK
jgi:hypothetical protein